MALVKYRCHVKHNGVDYKPGESIEVADAAEHLLRSAVNAEENQPAKVAPKKRRTAKAEA